MGICVATWNTEWATPSGDRGPRISAVLADAGADVVVVTEGVRELLPATGSVVDAGDDWGYGPQPRRRKVIVWSRLPLSCDAIGESGATRGRLVVTTAETAEGPVRVVGVCIPWRDAHVSTGRGDSQPWSEHLDYLDYLAGLLAELDDDVPTVIAGDFNQRIPRLRQPAHVADRLNHVLADWTIHTAGALPNGPHIDHIATNQWLNLQWAHDWPAYDHLGRLSDHAGVTCRFTFVDRPSRSVGKAAWIPDPAPAQRPHDGPLPANANVSPKPATARASAPSPESTLTPELRSEIEDVLRRSGDGLSHGATFRLREQGLSDSEIAEARSVSVSATRVFLRSLDALLTGTLPSTKSLALTNSYVYRELLNHPRSANLDSYVRGQLRTLKEINPAVSFAPLKTRTHQYKVGQRKPKTVIEDWCPECAAVGIVHAGRC